MGTVVKSGMSIVVDTHRALLILLPLVSIHSGINLSKLDWNHPGFRYEPTIPCGGIHQIVQDCSCMFPFNIVHVLSGATATGSLHIAWRSESTLRSLPIG